MKPRKIYLIKNKENVGISKGSNQAVNAIGDRYDVIMKVDPDALFQNEGWLKAMINIRKRNRRIALSCYISGLRDNPGGAPREAYGELAGEMLGMTRHLGGICHFVDAKAYKTFRWREDDFLHGAQDLEFSQYLGRAGFQMAYLENWFVSHGPTDTETQHKDYPEYFNRRKREKTTRYEAS